MKEIRVTDSYLQLGPDRTGCEDHDTIQDCKTHKYISQFLDKCGCLPFSISLTDKVTYEVHYDPIFISLPWLLIQIIKNNKSTKLTKTKIQESICSEKDYDCVNNVQVNTSNCLPSCSGLTLTSYSKTENDNMENVPNEIAEYNTNYRKMFPFPSRLKGFMF